MSTPRGIFEETSSQTLPDAPPASPFTVATEREASPVPNPFTAASPEKASKPSAVSDDESRKPSESPFQISEPQDYGFEAPQHSVQAFRASPFGTAAASPQQEFAASQSSDFDSFSIKQLELRAIFGVDCEMTKDEIIQRSRSLPGLRHMALLSEQDTVIVEALRQVVSNLGFGKSPIKIYSGSLPIDFIREGNILLAVQTDGGFAPGVRESLMLVARELNK